MINALLLLFPFLLSPQTAPNLPQIIQSVELPPIVSNSQPDAPQQATEPIKDPIECSCVQYVNSLEPVAPLFNAIDYPVNTIKPKVGDIIKLQYFNATTSGYIYHIAFIKEISETTYKIAEANFEKCKSGEREIEKSDDNIVGFFSVDLWKEITALPLEMYKTLQCESNFSHYRNGAIKCGDAGEIGIAQFMRPTWKWATDLRRRNNEKEILLDIFDAKDQIKQMKYLWDLGYKNHWMAYESECYKKLGTSPVEVN